AMYGELDPGVVHRTLPLADLNIADNDGNAGGFQASTIPSASGKADVSTPVEHVSPPQALSAPHGAQTSASNLGAATELAIAAWALPSPDRQVTGPQNTQAECFVAAVPDDRSRTFRLGASISVPAQGGAHRVRRHSADVLGSPAERATNA